MTPIDNMLGYSVRLRDPRKIGKIAVTGGDTESEHSLKFTGLPFVSRVLGGKAMESGGRAMQKSNFEKGEF